MLQGRVLKGLTLFDILCIQVLRQSLRRDTQSYFCSFSTKISIAIGQKTHQSSHAGYRKGWGFSIRAVLANIQSCGFPLRHTLDVYLPIHYEYRYYNGVYNPFQYISCAQTSLDIPGLQNSSLAPNLSPSLPHHWWRAPGLSGFIMKRHYISRDVAYNPQGHCLSLDILHLHPHPTAYCILSLSTW